MHADDDNYLARLITACVPCDRLMDSLFPGKINWNDKMFQTPKIEAMRTMRERERIAQFSKMVQEFGVTDTYTFPTESLHEKGAINLAQVCSFIRALGIEVMINECYLESIEVRGRHLLGFSPEANCEVTNASYCIRGDISIKTYLLFPPWS